MIEQAGCRNVCVNSPVERSLEKVRLFRSLVAPVSDQVSLFQNLRQRSEGLFQSVTVTKRRSPISTVLKGKFG